MQVDAILPAGGRLDGEFATATGVQVKALLPMGGGSLLSRTVQALRDSRCVNRIVVIGPSELEAAMAPLDVQALLPEGDTGPENIFRGLQWLQEKDDNGQVKKALIVTTDLPFLTPGGVAQFIARSPADAHLCMPAYTREQMEARFPGLGGKYVRLRDGHWTLGSVFLVDTQHLVRSREHLDRIFAARKNQFAMARLLGILFIARFVTRRLTLTHIQQRCEKILGCTGAAVLGCAPELALDIDTLEEYRYAQE